MLLDDESQTELPLVDAHMIRLRGAELLQCCRDIAKSHGWDRSARELDAAFNPEGRSVSVGVLRNGLMVHERNYARAEWLGYFAMLSEEPAQVLATCAGKTLSESKKLTPEAELEILRERVSREFGLQGARLVASIGGRRR